MHDLHVQQTFKTPLASLFNAWRDPSFVRQWFAPGEMTVPELAIDFRVGGSYRIVMQGSENERHVVCGQYREIIENERICFSWQWEGSPVITEVELSFQAAGEDSAMELTHRQFPDTEQRDKHNQGWHACIANLDKALAQKGVVT